MSSRLILNESDPLAPKYSYQGEINKQLMAEIASMRVMMNQMRGNGSESSVRSTSSVQPHAKISRPLRLNGYVTMKSRHDSSRTIAQGYLRSLDQATVVGGQSVGKNWCAVSVQVLVDPSEALFRPFDIFQIIGDVVGISVAWPKHFVFAVEAEGR